MENPSVLSLPKAQRGYSYVPDPSEGSIQVVLFGERKRDVQRLAVAPYRGGDDVAHMAAGQIHIAHLPDGLAVDGGDDIAHLKPLDGGVRVGKDGGDIQACLLYTSGYVLL